MSCNVCHGLIGSSRDPTCLACCAVACLRDEIRSEWYSGSVRGLATDLLVSTSRQVRALRICTLRIGQEAVAAEETSLPARTRDPAPSRVTEKERVKEEAESDYECSDEASTPKVVGTEKRGPSHAEGVTAKPKAEKPKDVKEPSKGPHRSRQDGASEEGAGRGDRTVRRRESGRNRTHGHRRRRRDETEETGEAREHERRRQRRRHPEDHEQYRGTTDRSGREEARSADRYDRGVEVPKLHERHFTLVEDRAPIAQRSKRSQWRR